MTKMSGQTVGKMVMGIRIVPMGDMLPPGGLPNDVALKRAAVTWGGYIARHRPVGRDAARRDRRRTERRLPALGQAAAADVRRQVQQDGGREDQVVFADTNRGWPPVGLCFVCAGRTKMGSGRFAEGARWVMAGLPPWSDAVPAEWWERLAARLIEALVFGVFYYILFIVLWGGLPNCRVAGGVRRPAARRVRLAARRAGIYGL